MNEPLFILPPTPSPPVALLNITEPVLAEVELIDPVTVMVVAAASPRTGLDSEGLVALTTAPVPVEVVLPVPPFKTGKAVPDSVISRVPLLVIGEPLIDKKAGTVAATEVTVPVPVRVSHVIAEDTPPWETRTWPAVPAVVGRLKFQVPATAWGSIETVPEVAPLTNKLVEVTDEVHDSDVEDTVVKAPLPAVPDPIAPGAAKVAPFKELAFKLATLVVEVTMSGAVPVAILLTR
jgi:hypothetical protein